MDQGVELGRINPEQMTNRDLIDYRLSRGELRNIGGIHNESITERIGNFEGLVHWATSMPHLLRLSAISSANLGVGRDTLGKVRRTFSDETSDVHIADKKNNREIVITTQDGVTQVRINDIEGQTDPDFPRLLYSLRMPATDLTRLLTAEKTAGDAFPSENFYAVERVNDGVVRYEPAKVENRNTAGISQGFARVVRTIARTIGDTLPQDTEVRDIIVKRMDENQTKTPAA